MSPDFRPALPDDLNAAIPLIYSSGPDAFEYGFTVGSRSAQDFLGYAFADGRGFFGWRNHTVALLEQRVAGIGAFYSGHEYARLSNEVLLQMLRYYPLRAVPGLLRRALQLKAMMPPPQRDMHYIAHLGVNPALRSHGIGAALLCQQQRVARELGRRRCALDVSVLNPRGQALYERLGFVVTGAQHFRGPAAAVADCRRMELPLRN